MSKVESIKRVATLKGAPEFAAYIKKDLAKWVRVVKEAGVTAE